MVREEDNGDGTTTILPPKTEQAKTRSGKLIPCATDPMWGEKINPRQYGLRGYTSAITIPSRMGYSDRNKLLVRFFPAWTREDFEDAGQYFASVRVNAERAWSATASAAAHDCWGRDYLAFDYKISGIASEDFAPGFRDALRHLARLQSLAAAMAIGFQGAAKNFGRYRR